MSTDASSDRPAARDALPLGPAISRPSPPREAEPAAGTTAGSVFPPFAPALARGAGAAPAGGAPREGDGAVEATGSARAGDGAEHAAPPAASAAADEAMGEAIGEAIGEAMGEESGDGAGGSPGAGEPAPAAAAAAPKRDASWLEAIDWADVERPVQDARLDQEEEEGAGAGEGVAAEEPAAPADAAGRAFDLPPWMAWVADEVPDVRPLSEAAGAPDENAAPEPIAAPAADADAGEAEREAPPEFEEPAILDFHAADEEGAAGVEGAPALGTQAYEPISAQPEVAYAAEGGEVDEEGRGGELPELDSAGTMEAEEEVAFAGLSLGGEQAPAGEPVAERGAAGEEAGERPRLEPTAEEVDSAAEEAALAALGTLDEAPFDSDAAAAPAGTTWEADAAADGDDLAPDDEDADRVAAWEGDAGFAVIEDAAVPGPDGAGDTAAAAAAFEGPGGAAPAAALGGEFSSAALHEVAERLEGIAASLRSRSPAELLTAGGDDPLDLLLTGFALGYASGRGKRPPGG